jgi:hypothetical protein
MKRMPVSGVSSSALSACRSQSMCRFVGVVPGDLLTDADPDEVAYGDAAVDAVQCDRGAGLAGPGPVLDRHRDGIGLSWHARNCATGVRHSSRTLSACGSILRIAPLGYLVMPSARPGEMIADGDAIQPAVLDGPGESAQFRGTRFGERAAGRAA